VEAFDIVCCLCYYFVLENCNFSDQYDVVGAVDIVGDVVCDVDIVGAVVGAVDVFGV
jgi:hypothetical protein